MASSVHASGSGDRSETQTSWVASNSGSGAKSGGVQAPGRVSPSNASPAHAQPLNHPLTESTVNVVALEVIGNPVVLGASVIVGTSIARDTLASHFHQIHRFLESHTHNIRSLQDFITTSIAEPAVDVRRTQGGSALPSSTPHIPNLPSSSSEFIGILNL